LHDARLWERRTKGRTARTGGTRRRTSGTGSAGGQIVRSLAVHGLKREASARKCRGFLVSEPSLHEIPRMVQKRERVSGEFLLRPQLAFDITHDSFSAIDTTSDPQSWAPSLRSEFVLSTPHERGIDCLFGLAKHHPHSLRPAQSGHLSFCTTSHAWRTNKKSPRSQAGGSCSNSRTPLSG
jgi:hypothetical protein